MGRTVDPRGWWSSAGRNSMVVVGFACVSALGGGCGRIGFAELPDAEPVVNLPACDAPIALGVLPDVAPSRFGSRWLAGAATPRGLAIVYTSADGVSAVSVDLAAPGAPLRGPPVVIGGPIDSNLQLIVSGDRIVMSGGMASGATTARAPTLRIVIVDPDLGPIATRTELSVFPSAPDHSTTRAGGGLILAGALDQSVQMTAIDDDGGYLASASWPLAMARGGTVTTLAGGGYAAAWYDGAGGCAVRVFDEALAEQAATTIPTCEYVRTSAIGDRIALSWFGAGAAAVASIADRSLAPTHRSSCWRCRCNHPG